jgi:hypothetical protein
MLSWKAEVMNYSMVPMVSAKAQGIFNNSTECLPKPDYTLKVPPLMEIRSRQSISPFSGLIFGFNGALSMFNAKDYGGAEDIPNAPTQSISGNCFSI